MSGLFLMLLLGAIVLAMIFPRLWHWATVRAEWGGRHGETIGAFWFVLAWLISLGYGAWAVHLMWQAIPRGELGWGGLIYLILAIPVFAIGMVAALWIQVRLIRGLGGMLAMIAAMSVLAAVFILPLPVAVL